MCYHMTRKPISVVKSVLHRNCSQLEMPEHIKMSLHGENDGTWCDYPPFGELNKLWVEFVSKAFATIAIGMEIDSVFLCGEAIE